MMNPDAMKFAMEQMNRMSPEQMQAMMSSMGNINPEMMRMAQQQMGNMSAADWERAKQQISSTDPATLAAQARAAQETMSAQQKYVLSGSQQLKAEGNRLHTAGQFGEAAEKYERAKTNLEGFTSSEAKELRRACVLNLGSCYLQLGRFHDAVDHCDMILADEPRNIKALYRRGQAHSALKQHQAAVADLEAALQEAAGDPKQGEPIREKLEAARKQLAAEQQSRPAAAGDDEDGVVEEVVEARAASSSRHGQPGTEGVVIEEIDCTGAAASPAAASAAASGSACQATPSSSAASTSSSSRPRSTPAAAAGGGGMMGMSPEDLQRMQEMMQQNPDMMNQAAEMMRSMDPQQLAAMSAQMGMPVPPELLADPNAMKAAMSNLNPQQMSEMAELASKMQAGGGSPADMQAAAELMRKNPEMVKTSMEMLRSMPKEQLEQALAASGSLPPGMDAGMALQAAEMLKSMPPETLAKMTEMAAAAEMPGLSSSAAAAGSGGSARAVGASSTTPSSSSTAAVPASPAASGAGLGGMGGVPPGMSPDMMTPEAMSMAMEMMKNMKPEDMAAMAEMAAAMQGAQGPDGTMDPTQLMGKIKPDMVGRMLSSVKNMDATSLSKMLMQSGVDKEKADAMAQQLKEVDPKWTDLLIKVATFLFAVFQWLLTAKQRLVAQPMLLIGLLVLLLAIVLRLFGVM